MSWKAKHTKFGRRRKVGSAKRKRAKKKNK